MSDEMGGVKDNKMSKNRTIHQYRKVLYDSLFFNA